MIDADISTTVCVPGFRLGCFFNPLSIFLLYHHQVLSLTLAAIWEGEQDVSAWHQRARSCDQDR